MPFTKGHKINLGIPRTEETRRKLSIANKGQISWLKGGHISEETKRKIGEANKISLLGKKLPQEVRNKIGLANRGKKRSAQARINIGLGKKGSKNPHYGKHLSEKTRKKLSQSMKKFWGPRIDKNHNELYHRIRHSLENRIWRENVLKRDNYTCVWCGDNTGGNLEADHIKPFILIIRQNNIKTLQEALKCFELWDISNGRTLCEDCHKLTNSWGSKARDKMI